MDEYLEDKDNSALNFVKITLITLTIAVILKTTEVTPKIYNARARTHTGQYKGSLDILE